MSIKQISVFVENTFGSAADTLSVLAKENIDIRALSIADTADYGIMRLIVDAPEKANELLRSQGIIVRQTDVLAIPIADAPGGLSSILGILCDGKVSIEYMYAFVGRQHGNAILVTKTGDDASAVSALEQHGIEPLDSSDLF